MLAPSPDVCEHLVRCTKALICACPRVCVCVLASSSSSSSRNQCVSSTGGAEGRFPAVDGVFAIGMQTQSYTVVLAALGRLSKAK